MHGFNCATYCCSSSRTTPVVTLQRSSNRGKYFCSYIYQDRVIDEDVKRQTKKQTLYTCRLLPLTWIFQYISNWSKVFELLRASLFDIHRVISFEVFLGKQFLNWLGRFMYKLSQHFFIYHSCSTSNFESTYKKPPFITIDTFFWCNFSIKLSWLQRKDNKTNTILYERYYL